MKHWAFFSLSLAGAFAVLSSGCHFTNPIHKRSSPADIVTQAAPKPPLGLFTRLDSSLVPEKKNTNVPYMVNILTRIVELPTKSEKGSRLLTDEELQKKLRRWRAQQRTEVVAAPSVITKSQSKARIEIIRELVISTPATREVVNLGTTCEFNPIHLKDGRIHLSGVVTLREMDGDVQSLEGGGGTVSVHSSDTYLSTEMKSDQHLLLLCRTKNLSGQRIAIISASAIDPSGQPVKLPRN